MTAKDPKQRGLEESLGVYRLGLDVTLQSLIESESFKPWSTLRGSARWGIHFGALLSRAIDFGSGRPHSGIYTLGVYFLGQPVLDLAAHSESLHSRIDKLSQRFWISPGTLGATLWELPWKGCTLRQRFGGYSPLSAPPILDLVDHSPSFLGGYTLQTFT